MAGQSSDYRERLIAARTSLNLSVPEMAHQLCTPESEYESWESGQCPTPGVAAAAAGFLLLSVRGAMHKAVQHELEKGNRDVKQISSLTGAAISTIYNIASKSKIPLGPNRSGRQGVVKEIVLELRTTDSTLQEIADKYGVTKQRVGQLAQKHVPERRRRYRNKINE